MEWLNIILGGIVATLAGLNVFQLTSFRAYKKKYQAVAEKERAEADAAKQSTLEARLVAIEKLYAAQGEVIDDLRKQVLAISREKFESEKRIIQLEGENQALKERVEWLDKSVQSYKTLYERGPVIEQKF